VSCNSSECPAETESGRSGGVGSRHPPHFAHTKNQRSRRAEITIRPGAAASSTTTGFRPLCRKKQAIRQSKWPALYGARTEIWYRQPHLVTSPTGFGRVKVVSTLGTGRQKCIFLRHRGLSPVEHGYRLAPPHLGVADERQRGQHEDLELVTQERALLRVDLAEPRLQVVWTHVESESTNWTKFIIPSTKSLLCHTMCVRGQKDCETGVSVHRR